MNPQGCKFPATTKKIKYEQKAQLQRRTMYLTSGSI